MNRRRITKALSLTVLVAVAWLPAVATVADEPAADPMTGKEAGQVRDDNGLKMKLVWCLPGTIAMEEVERIGGPTTPVKAMLTEGFWLGQFEVTQAKWKEMMATEPSKGRQLVEERDDCPVTWVTWDDATEFCSKLTAQERGAGRLSSRWEYTLPMEAQWERACRAGTESRFSFGDDASKLSEYAWTQENALKAGEKYAHPVGQKKPNAWGLHDMHGNVLEWCLDVYATKLPGGRNPRVTEGGSGRVLRGGAWSYAGQLSRSAARDVGSPSERGSYLGFRVALSPVQSAK